MSTTEELRIQYAAYVKTAIDNREETLGYLAWLNTMSEDRSTK